MAQETSSPEQEPQEEQVAQRPQEEPEHQAPQSQQDQIAPGMPHEEPPVFDVPRVGGLPTFFQLLAVSLGVSPDDSKGRGANAGEGNEEATERSRYMPLLASIAAVIVATGIMAAMPDSSEPLPISLMGAWQTSSEQYADRGFEIKPEHITFQQGEADKYTTHPITRLRANPTENGSTLYVFEYDNAGDTYEFSFVYQQDEETIRFKNQPLIAWRKGP